MARLFLTPSLTACLLLLASAALRAQQPTSLQLDPARLDSDPVTAGALLEQTLTICNPGPDPIRLLRLGVNGSLDLALTAEGKAVPIARDQGGAVGFTLAEGQSATLTLTMDTDGMRAGRHQYQVVLVADDRPAPHIVPLTVQVTAPKGLPSGPAPRLELDPALVSLGTLLLGELSETTARIRNTGQRDLAIQQIRSTCSCAAGSLTLGKTVLDQDAIEEASRRNHVATLAPGEVAILHIVFDSREIPVPLKEPALRKGISLYTNDPERPMARITLEARIEPAFELSPTTLQIEPVLAGHAGTATARLYSTRLEGYQVRSVELNHPDRLAVEHRLVEAGARPTYELVVTIKDTAPIGWIRDEVLVRLDHPRIGEVRLPIMGEVLSPVEFQGPGSARSTQLDLGRMEPGQARTIDLHIRNLDPSVPYTLQRVILDSPLADGLLETELTTTREGQEYLLRIKAAGAIPPGPIRGTLSLITDHPHVPVKRFLVRGEMPAR